MQWHGFVARKTNGQLVPFGNRGSYSAGYYPEITGDVNRCVDGKTRPECFLSEADKNETGWLFNASTPFSEHPKDSPCGG
eukprot:scaffold65598_cov63-Phaeocystis_antarctica.AAC.1